MKRILTIISILLTTVSSLTAQTTLYGFTRDYPYALLQIDAESPSKTVRIGSSEVMPTAGAFVKNSMIITGMDEDFNTLLYRVNLTDGSLTKLKNLGENAALPVEMSYDYTTDKMYFITNSEKAEGMSALWTLNLSTYAMTKVQDNMGASVRALAIDVAGEMYGLSRDGKLYPVDKSTGKVGTMIGATGHSPQLFTAMDFDRTTGKLYWACYENSTVKLYEINPSTATATELGVIGSGNGLMTVALDMPYAPSADNAPAKVDTLWVKPAEGGVLEATVNWQNPALTAAGQPLETITKVEVLRGEDIIATLETEGFVKPGMMVSYEDATVPASGEYRYTVKVYNSVGPSAGRSVDAYVGHDLLAAPQRVVAALGATLGLPALTNVIAWDAATVGQHGGYVVTDNIVYDVIRVNDGKVIIEGTNKEACYDEALADTLTRYVYQVTPRNTDGNGEAKESNYLVNGPAAKVPFKADFDKKADADLWTVLDVNQDGYAFIWHRYLLMEGKGMYIYQTHEYNYALDMIVTPPVEFQEGHTYRITVSCCNSFAPYPESFKLYSLAGYTTQGAVPVGEPVERINHPHEFKPYTFELTAEDDGIGASDETFVSFVGVCCTSDPSMQMFLVEGVTIEDVTAAGIENEELRTKNEESATAVYDLQGRRVAEDARRSTLDARLSPGLYIVNGKKYVKK